MAERRTGSKFIARALGAKSRLAVLHFSTEQDYILEHCGDLIRFYRPAGSMVEGKLAAPLVA